MDIALVIRGFGSDRAVESVVRHILIMPETYTFQEEALDDFVKVETLDGNNQVIPYIMVLARCLCSR